MRQQILTHFVFTIATLTPQSEKDSIMFGEQVDNVAPETEKLLDPATRNVLPSQPKALHAAAGLSILAALLHLWLMAEHMAESLSYGSFFIGVALAQGLYGVALLRWPSRSVVRLGLWGTLAGGVSYAAMRYVQPSFGPHGEHVGGFEVLAMLCTAATLGLLSSLLLNMQRMIYTAEILSLGLALVYLWVAQERYAEWWGFGAFFLALGMFQGLYCLGLSHLGGRLSFLVGGIAANLSVVALWAMTRTVGTPYIRTTGIESSELRLGKTEGVGLLDLGATTMEVAIIVVLTMMIVRFYIRNTPPTGRTKTDLRRSTLTSKRQFDEGVENGDQR